MPTRSFDVVILGGGNAGMGVTVATRESGAQGRDDRAGSARRHLPQPRLPAEKSAGRGALDEIERAKAHQIHVGSRTYAERAAGQRW